MTITERLASELTYAQDTLNTLVKDQRRGIQDLAKDAAHAAALGEDEVPSLTFLRMAVTSLQEGEGLINQARDKVRLLTYLSR